MIKIEDVAGNEKYINCELIEKIEIIPDTLITLVNGHSFIVKETAEEIVNKIAEFKRRCNMTVQTIPPVEIKTNTAQSSEKEQDEKEEQKES